MIDPQEFVNEAISEAYALVGEYKVYLKGIPQSITIKIWQCHRSYGGDWFTFDTSHFIKTPVQLDMYCPSAPYGPNEESTLRSAIQSFTMYYGDAVERGHTPMSEWLIPNESF